MNAAEVLKACVEQSTLPFMVIGGFAVIAHGYHRTTMDLDLLIRKAHAEQWTNVFKRIGYDLDYAHQTFARYDATFDGMFAAAVPTEFAGVPVRVPSFEHLLALKCMSQSKTCDTADYMTGMTL